MGIDAAGGLTVGQRLDRIEASVVEVLRKLDIFAKETDLQKVESRVTIVEQGQSAFVRRGALWAMLGFCIVQTLVIIGLGLGLVYELLKQH